jgi:hypothetical protein
MIYPPKSKRYGKESDKLLRDEKGEALGGRSIQISSFGCGDTAIIVEGTLIDKRLGTGRTVTGKNLKAGVVHHMIIRIRVEAPDMTISHVESEMVSTPNAHCPEINDSLQMIRGMRIVPGFTETVKKKIGGRNGCAHLTALLLAMAPAAVQGLWTRFSKTAHEDRETTAHVLDRYLIDTCWVWRKDGPMAEKLIKEMDDHGVSMGSHG